MEKKGKEQKKRWEKKTGRVKNKNKIWERIKNENKGRKINEKTVGEKGKENEGIIEMEKKEKEQTENLLKRKKMGKNWKKREGKKK